MSYPSYLDATLGFVVLDHRRDDFNRREAVKALKAPRLAVLDLPYYRDKMHAYLPQAEEIVVHSVREFFQNETDRFDALVLTAQTGSAWCLIYPNFSVAVPLPDAMAFLTSWIQLKKKDEHDRRAIRLLDPGRDNEAPRAPLGR